MLKYSLLSIFIAISANASAAQKWTYGYCPISANTANQLIQYRHANIVGQKRFDGAVFILQSDTCFRSKQLEASEIKHVVYAMVLNLKLEDKWLAGSINEYLHM